ncbi:MAG: diaminopimelate decarboxylase [Bacteroidales bacterium]|nr:diaminopimelate decarboxylase [Bacteroidales bacterium]
MKNKVDFTNIKTPAYLYNISLLEQTLNSIQKLANQYKYHVHYALKANNNPRILQTISGFGFGADCVSGNEIKEAIKQGFKTSQIAFAGVGKTDEEINYALEQEIFSFNCESLPEIEVINELAQKMQKTASLALRINPNVDANTHKYITTGLEENKFGINLWDIDSILDAMEGMQNVKLTGIHFHIGSQITDLDTFKNLSNRINQIQEKLYARQLIVDHINVGGGLGINYHQPDEDPIPDFESYFKIFHDFLELRPKQQLHFELGRSIVGQMGSLLSKVIYVKKASKKDFLIIDAAMTDLIRPALYQAYHKIENLSSTCEEKQNYDVVGPVCESADIFAKAVSLPKSQRGDYILIRSAGAYGQVMSSNYNMRDNAQVVFVD